MKEGLGKCGRVIYLLEKSVEERTGVLPASIVHGCEERIGVASNGGQSVLGRGVSVNSRASL